MVQDDIVDKILEAIPGTRGIASTLAKKLGMSSSTIRDLINTYPVLVVAMQAEKEDTFDDIENKLIEEALDGKAWAVRYYLDYQGHKRGYGVPAFSAAPKGFTLTVVYETPKQLAVYPEEELLTLEGEFVESDSRNTNTPEKTSQETS